MKKICYSIDKEKGLIISTSFIPKDFFYKSLFILYCILKYKIQTILLANNYIIEYDILDKGFVNIVCKILEIEA